VLHRIRRGEPIEQARERGETAVGGGAHGGGKSGNVKLRLLDEELRLSDLFREHDLAASRGHAQRVLLGGECGGGDHASSGSHRINRLPGEWRREAGG